MANNPFSCVCNCKDTNLKAIHNAKRRRRRRQFCCVCNCKDTNLKAIHNILITLRKRKRVVFATAKILIWKQFTTHFQSNLLKFRCVCNCKDTNLKAIHNLYWMNEIFGHVVFATAKILIWKQFTTQLLPKMFLKQLCLQLQRY